jgi:hypothetical protein
MRQRSLAAPSKLTPGGSGEPQTAVWPSDNSNNSTNSSQYFLYILYVADIVLCVLYRETSFNPHSDPEVSVSKILIF